MGSRPRPHAVLQTAFLSSGYSCRLRQACGGHAGPRRLHLCCLLLQVCSWPWHQAQRANHMPDMHLNAFSAAHQLCCAERKSQCVPYWQSQPSSPAPGNAPHFQGSQRGLLHLNTNMRWHVCRCSTVRTLCGQDYVKDLSRLGRDLGRTVLVDNDPFSGLLQPCNVLPTRAFYGEASDR